MPIDKTRRAELVASIGSLALLITFYAYDWRELIKITLIWIFCTSISLLFIEDVIRKRITRKEEE